jgi:hypothetical protein
LFVGNQPRERRLEELPRGVVERTLDAELPDERRILGALLLPYTGAVACREL